MFERIALIVTTAVFCAFVFWVAGKEGLTAAATGAVNVTRTIAVSLAGLRAANDGSLYQDPADEVVLGKPAAAKPSAYRAPPVEAQRAQPIVYGAVTAPPPAAPIAAAPAEPAAAPSPPEALYITAMVGSQVRAMACRPVEAVR